MVENFTPLSNTDEGVVQPSFESRKVATSLSSENPLFAGVNKYLIALSLVFVGIIVYSYFVLSKKPDVAVPSDGPMSPAAAVKLVEGPTQAPPLVREQSTNYREFDAIKKHAPNVGDDGTATIGFEGVVLQIFDDSANAAYKIQLVSQVSATKGTPVWYHYDRSDLDKIQIYKHGLPNPTYSLADLSVGDRVEIFEKRNFSKIYQDSLVEAEIKIL